MSSIDDLVAADAALAASVNAAVAKLGQAPVPDPRIAQVVVDLGNMKTELDNAVNPPPPAAPAHS